MKPEDWIAVGTLLVIGLIFVGVLGWEFWAWLKKGGY